MTNTTYDPTPEQQAAIDAFHAGGSLVVEAGAGTGKTSTLRFIGASTPQRGQFIAFNKAIVNDAAAVMPGNVACSTAHSLAYRAVGKTYGARLRSSARMKSMEIARRLQINPLTIRYGTETRVLSSGYLAGLTMRAVTLFCQSADLAPGAEHVPYIDGIDAPRDNGSRTYDNNREVAKWIAPAMRRAWDDIQNVQGVLPFKHEHYLKIWQLSNPVIPADFILFDEAQDASPVLLAVVEAQAHAQLVFVGDSNQCQPSGTMVKVVRSTRRGNRFIGWDPTMFGEVPIETLKAGDRVVTFSIANSFLRRTGRLVKEVASRPYDGEMLNLTADGLETRMTPNHRCVVRVGDAFEGKWVVYLMRKGNSFRVGMTTGVYATQDGNLGLSMRSVCEGADGAWVLSTHDSAAEARMTEALTAHRFGIPTLTFKASNLHRIEQAELDGFWSKVGDLTDRGRACLVAHGRLIEHPFCSAGKRVYRRRSQEMVAANILDGMLVLPMANALDAEGKQVPQKHWAEATIRREWYTGMVWSLDVADDGTYVADGIVTHNSIYGFTGAVDALAKVNADRRTRLSQSFRFGQPVAEVANDLLALIGSDMRLLGSPLISSVVGPVAEPDAILTRTNAGAMTTVFRLIKEGHRPHLVGGGVELVSFARAAADLMDGRTTMHPELACFSDWADVQEYVANDEQGGDLRLMVKLVDDFGPEAILSALGGMPSETAATIIVSTAHKSKGRQWGSVQLAGDFPEPKDNQPVPSLDELRLLYVAVTRARYELDIEAVKLLIDSREAPETDEPLAPGLITCVVCEEAFSPLLVGDDTMCGACWQMDQDTAPVKV